jgi:Transglycosylase SLT domain
MWATEAVSMLRDVAGRLGVDARDMVKVMANESGCLPNAHNPGGAVGLIQFEPSTLRDEEWTQGTDAFAVLHVVDQLPFVERYYAARKTAILAAGGGVGPLYVATFLPALTSHAGDLTYVLCGAQGPLAWAYASNKGFDVERLGYITVGMLVDAAERAYARCALAQEIVAALDALDAATAQS